MKNLVAPELIASVNNENNGNPTLLKTPLDYVTFPIRTALGKQPAPAVQEVASSVNKAADALAQIVPSTAVSELMKMKMDQLLDSVEEDAFFVSDLGEILRQHRRWIKNLPRIEPFYGSSSG